MKSLTRCPFLLLAAALAGVVSLAGCGQQQADLSEHSNVNLTALTAENFDAEVLQSSTPVVVDFWASWCGPCRKMAPIFAETAAAYQGRVKFGKVDVDQQQKLAQSYEVSAIPTLVFFQNGEVVDRAVGLLTKPELLSRLDKLAPAQTTE